MIKRFLTALLFLLPGVAWAYEPQPSGTAPIVVNANNVISCPTCSTGTSIGSTITSATQGSVLFVGPSSALAQNNAKLFWDNTAFALGIGGQINQTNYPGELFNFSGAAASGGYIQANCQDTTASGQCGYTATANDGTDSTHYAGLYMNNGTSPSAANTFFINPHAMSIYNVDAEVDFGAGLVSGTGGVFNWYNNQYATPNMTLNATGLSVTNSETVGGTLGVTGGVTAASLTLGSGATLQTYTSGFFTPVFVNLTVVGTPTYSGTYTKIGNMVFCQVAVSSTTTTASTFGTTSFSGLPFSVSYAGTVSAANTNATAAYTTGFLSASGSVFTPTWAATQSIVLQFFYMTSSN